MYILYEDTAFLIDDFLESFSPSLAVISHSWPICAFGTASNQETVRLSAELLPAETKQNPTIEVVQQSISGQETDSLQTLCLQIDCTDHETAVKVYRLLTCMNWRTNIAVAGRLPAVSQFFAKTRFVEGFPEGKAGTRRIRVVGRRNLRRYGQQPYGMGIGLAGSHEAAKISYHQSRK